MTCCCQITCDMLGVSNRKVVMKMNSKMVSISEKTLVGLSAKTANNDSNMGKIIGGLWERLFGEGVFFAIPNKCNNRSIGLYSNYASDVSEGYDITVGCEVSSVGQLPEGTVVKTISGGRYAKFVTHGNDDQAVGKLWQEIWNLPLERTYTGDFEEYDVAPIGTPREIHIYIAIKQQGDCDGKD